MTDGRGHAQAIDAGPKAFPLSTASPYLPALLLLFVGSGCAALIYQVVWFQMLSLIIGSSAISLGLLLAIFMGGMCIGSVGLPYVVRASRHPLRIYAWIEFGIAAFGVFVLLALPLIGPVYAALGGSGLGGLVLRAVLAVIMLLPPAILMGATLPAIARWVESTPRGVAWLGFFYAGNIAGAVLGCLLAGFYLLRVHDVTVATLVAALINVAVGAMGLLLCRASTYHPPAAATAAAGGRIEPGAWPVYVAIGLSGLTALGAEVIWTRLLSLLLGATVYTFSLILAAFLLGLGIGSSVGAFMARNMRDPRLGLGLCQLLLVLTLGWAAYALTSALPYWPVNPDLSISPWVTFQIDFVRALTAVLPAALLWGASFPLALAAVASRQDRDPGHLVGGVYAANTVGAILGALLASLLIIGTLGTQWAQRLLIVIAGISALFVLGLTTSGTSPPKLQVRRSNVLWALLTAGLVAVLAAGVNPPPWLLVAHGRYMPTWLEGGRELVFVGEGTHASLAVTRSQDGVLNYHNAGKVQASSDPTDMRLQRMLGHMTTLLPENPRSVLVIGFGAGVTAGAVSIDPRVEKVTIAEIERLVPKVVSTHFGDHNFNVARNPKTDIRIDDARHFLLTTDQKFDAITSDPFDPWVKGAATLYTREFFEVMRERLNPGGVVTIFVQLYQAGLDATKSEIATFMEVFPNATVWANTYQGSGYDLVLMGQVEPTSIDLDVIEARLALPEYAPVVASLAQIGMYSSADLFVTHIGDGTSLAPWLADAQVNRDRNLRLQYLAGMNHNRSQTGLIHEQMAATWRYPEGLFKGSPERVAALRARMGSW